MDLKNALKTIPTPTIQELKSIQELEYLFQNTIILQKKLKEEPELKVRGFLKNLSEQVEEIQMTILSVLNEEINKCSNSSVLE